MPSNGDGTGQVPPSSSPDSNGQVPPVSQAQTSTASDSSGTSSSSSDGLTHEQALDALRKAREDAAKARVDSKRLAELEKRFQDDENAKLTEKERYEKERADWQAEKADLQRQRQEAAIRADIKLAAADLGIKQELARRILDYSAIEFDGEGDPKNVEKLLRAAAEEYGLTMSGPASSPAANGATNGAASKSSSPTSIGATPANPARNTSGISAGSWSWELISSLTKEQAEALTPAQRAAMSSFIRRNYRQ